MDQVTFSLLHRRLVSIGFDGWDAVCEEDVYRGDPHCYAGFMRSILAAFPHATAALLHKYPWLCVEGDDGALAHSVLRVLMQEYGRKPSITAMQFRATKYASAKIKTCIELFDLLSRMTARGRRAECSRAANKKESIAEMDSSRLSSCDSTALLLEAQLHSLDERKRALNRLSRV
ncbi:hypothetical protein DQ04_07491020 [Trypanosoma grayi]|uniref:hypothetical protein n=1 Tax=Trypanosoma grayi TaxID=71804 RepID=UPI0004F46EB4|nr:hypothetical protein DQ04_07491020 [Trypanosoma grayi]KEG08301.1 hypothetical protein DQ04_07491020 [Trypanosoma grayi]